MDKRTQKQIIIGLVFIFIIGGISYGFVDYLFVTEPTCFDSVKNGREEGVDCGLLACGVACEPVVLPLNIISQKLIEVMPGDYDFVAQINNPNSSLGASMARYNLNLAGDTGASSIRSGTFYILPGQTRFIIITGVRSGTSLSKISMNITEVKWERVKNFVNVNFLVQRKNYSIVNRNGVFSELEAVILNNSDFDFDKVEVGVVLFNENNDIIAVNKTDIRTLLSRTERYFKVSWPTELPVSIRQDVEILTNVFENFNFIKKYGTQERFQKYY